MHTIKAMVRLRASAGATLRRDADAAEVRKWSSYPRHAELVQVP
jgi:hypothetical protein